MHLGSPNIAGRKWIVIYVYIYIQTYNIIYLWQSFMPMQFTVMVDRMQEMWLNLDELKVS